MQNKVLYRKKLLETFKSFDLFCRDHKIKYYAAYGTLIGAVRHHGIIPWDDDIDVWMLPEDYYRFCSFKGNVDSHYDIIDSNNDNYWLLSLVKYVDTNTTLWEVEHFPCVTGVYIDIFKLDSCESSKAMQLRKEYDKVSYNLTYSMMKHTLGQYKNALLGFHFRTFFRYIIESLYYKPRYNKYLSEYINIRSKIESTNGDCLVSFDGLYGEKEVFKKEWFDSLIRLSFEGLEISAPSEYDKILKKLYGNYMELPPEDKRISHHSHYFLDLNRHLSIDEIKNRKGH